MFDRTSMKFEESHRKKFELKEMKCSIRVLNLKFLQFYNIIYNAKLFFLIMLILKSYYH